MCLLRCDPDGVVSVSAFAGPVTSAEVNGLRNGVEYLVRVIAVTRDGAVSRRVGERTPSTGMEGVVAGVIVEFTDSVNAREGSREVPGEDRVGEVDLTVGHKVTEDAVVVELSETVDVRPRSGSLVSWLRMRRSRGRSRISSCSPPPSQHSEREPELRRERCVASGR